MENNKPKKKRSLSVTGVLAVVFLIVLVWGRVSQNGLIIFLSVPVALAVMVSMFVFGNNQPNRFRHALTFGCACIIAWIACTFLLAYYWPHLVNNNFKKAIVDKGFGGGPIPVNTLYTEPQNVFANPLNATLPPGSSNLMTTGVNHDTQLVGGELDLSKGPLVLSVPDFSGRYYSVQFTDPFDTDFAYVGTRTTGTGAGNYLITGPGWKGEVPSGMKQISSPDNSVLVIARVLVYNDSDLGTAYDLAKQIKLTPLKTP